MIVLPNGFNVYPEDIENALRVAGLRDSVVVETRPGRIEAIVLAGRRRARRAPQRRATSPAWREPSSQTWPPSARGSTRSSSRRTRLGPNQRIAGWRLWPDEDFPRTHTLKIKRGPVRAWAIADTAASGSLTLT